MTPNFGDKVHCTTKLKRSINSNINNFTFKFFWEEVSFHDHKLHTGIFLGYRTLNNGIQNSEGKYTPQKYIKVALVCFSPKQNPIYVPAYQVEKIS